jgi:alpha-amylase
MKNGVMMQYFEWNMPNDGSLWKKLKADAENLSKKGITSVWIPPAYKADKQDSQGYSAYDLYDLGEFDQKGTVRTKYGTKQELKEAIAELHKHGISVYLDAVMNHKAGADFTEKFTIKEVNPSQRQQQVSNAYEIEGWTGFNFPGRNKKYSDFEWRWFHFSGVDYNQANKKKAIYQIQGEGKSWGKEVDSENGNYDYLMFSDIDFKHPDVRIEMKKWGMWVAGELDIDGMRLDAIKHIDAEFIQGFIESVRAVRGKQFYFVGEYWKPDINALNLYLDEIQHEINLFDVNLHYNMFEAAKSGKDYDFRAFHNNALVVSHPQLAVTFVDNHDSQKGSSLESQIKFWFKPLAYGFILLMKEGYPCVFYGDYYGWGNEKSPHREIIDILLEAREKYAYGQQQTYFDHMNTAGFVRLGDEEHPGSGLVFLMANGDNGNKIMNVGQERKGEIWHEITGSIKEEVIIDELGNGNFTVLGQNLAVWVQKAVNK